MGPELHNSIFLNPVDHTEVSEIIKVLKNKSTLDTKVSEYYKSREYSSPSDRRPITSHHSSRVSRDLVT